jgi:hypothetical protein
MLRLPDLPSAKLLQVPHYPMGLSIEGGSGIILNSAVDRLNIAQIVDIVSYFLFYALTR